MEKRMVLKYVLAILLTGIILLLPAGAVYLLLGWNWAGVVWAVLLYLNIMEMIRREAKQIDNMSSKKKDM